MMKSSLCEKQAYSYIVKVLGLITVEYGIWGIFVDDFQYHIKNRKKSHWLNDDNVINLKASQIHILFYKYYSLSLLNMVLIMINNCKLV